MGLRSANLFGKRFLDEYNQNFKFEYRDGFFFGNGTIKFGAKKNFDRDEICSMNIRTLDAGNAIIYTFSVINAEHEGDIEHIFIKCRIHVDKTSRKPSYSYIGQPGIIIEDRNDPYSKLDLSEVFRLIICKS